MNNRKKIICMKCNLEKLHYGLNMCSPCLRKYKRQTRPEFYLRTQYSEIKRRCQHPNFGKRYYYGKKFCSKEEFLNRFLNDSKFLTQYKIWQQKGFKRRDSPSIDRIDNNKDYTIDNIQILNLIDNCKKDWQIAINLFKDNKFINRFESQKQLAEYLKISPSYVCRILYENEGKWHNWKFQYAKP